MALGAILALVDPKPTLVHVVHDIRDARFTLQDCQLVENLAAQLGCEFVRREVFVAQMDGNLEHNARQARYRELCDVASQIGASYIATGHHGDDQLETVLMHLMRGSGVRGMGGVSPALEMGSIKVIRPMLEVTRAEVEQVCNDAGLEWRHDHTNDDQGYLRNRVRHSLVSVMREIEADVAKRASGCAESIRQAREAITQLTQEMLVDASQQSGSSWSWTRNELRKVPEALLVELVFIYVRMVLTGLDADQITRRAMDAYVQGVKSDDTEPHTHRLGPIVVDIQANRVTIMPSRDLKKHAEEAR